MKRRTILSACCAFAFPGLASAAIVNGTFETGNVSGWTPIGAASAKTAAVGITPTQGTFQGFLDTTGNFTALAPAVIASLGIPPSEIMAMGLGGAPVNGAGISQSVTVAAGDVLSFDWNFISDELNESPTFNDFGFFTINTSAYLLASRNSSTFNLASPPAGYDGQTNWATQTYTFPSAGTYTVGFGALNVGDSGHNSALLLDSVAVPESGTLMFLPFAAMGLLLWRRREVATLEQH